MNSTNEESFEKAGPNQIIHIRVLTTIAKQPPDNLHGIYEREPLALIATDVG